MDGCGQNLNYPLISRSNELQVTLFDSNAGASVNVTIEGTYYIFLYSYVFFFHLAFNDV